MALTYIQQNGSLGKSISYSNKYHPGATIASSGCGVASSLMIILNSTSYNPTLKQMASFMIASGARNGSDGTDMGIAAKAIQNKYGLKYTVTTDINKLKEHLKKGYKAICNVGKVGYFSSGGHYVVAGGINSKGQVIILDPYYYANKWTSTVNGVNRKKYFTYNSSTHEVYCSFNTLKADTKYGYYLFTPSKQVKIARSSQDAYKSKEPAKTSGFKSFTGVVNTKSQPLRVRSSTSVASTKNVVGSLAKGTKVNVIGQKDKFYIIKYKNKQAYVSKAYIKK